jgi:hypothetical protein
MYCWSRSTPQPSSKIQLPNDSEDGEGSDIYRSIIVPLLAGGAATAIGDLAVHPMDTLKTLQQA